MHPHEEPRLERGSHRADALETKTGTAQRGDEWYVFDETSGLIKDIRGYNAALAVKDIPIGELVDFDYKGRGYHLRHK